MLQVRRLSADGVPDPSFAIETPIVPAPVPLQILPSRDLGLLIVNGGVTRWNATGQGVSSFGVGGVLPVSARLLRELEDGRLVTFDDGAGLRQWQADGSADPAFVPHPLALPPQTVVGGATFLSDGRVVLIARTNDGVPELVAHRLLADGSLDLAFGYLGRVHLSVDIAPGATVLQTIALPDDSVLVRTSTRFGVSHVSYSSMRIATDGGVSGTPWSSDALVAVDPAGRVLEAGAFAPPIDYTFRAGRVGVRRRRIDGSPDTSLGPDGLVLLSVQAPYSPQYFRSFAAVGGLVGLADGRIVVSVEDRILRLSPGQ